MYLCLWFLNFGFMGVLNILDRLGGMRGGVLSLLDKLIGGGACFCRRFVPVAQTRRINSPLRWTWELKSPLLVGVLFLGVLDGVFAQDNYEIQVYGADLVAPKRTMVELHSNFTFNGGMSIVDGVYPDNHVFHETIEITHGFNEWLEVGFYLFNSIGSDDRTQYVGSHIRPRVRLPESYHFPLGLSMSAEVGWQKRVFSVNDWTLELRPVIDKKWDKWYVAFNPTFDKALHGLEADKGFVFSPNFKASYQVSKKYSPGIEYYGSVGPLGHLDPYANQTHQLFLSLDADYSEDWEFNVGVGYNFVPEVGAVMVKMIIGRRF